MGRRLASLAFLLTLSCAAHPHGHARAGRTAQPGVAGAAWNAGLDEVRHGSRVVLRQRSEAVAPVPPEALGAPYAQCDAELRAHGIDVARENGPALETARAVAGKNAARFDVLLVPGFTPLDLAVASAELHPEAQARLERAIEDLNAGAAPLVMVSGGNVHPDGTPFNEAAQMKRYLLGRGVPEARVLIEPCARHSHTNLRNAARLMMSAGVRRALIVTSRDQAYYFGNPRVSSFDARCLSDLGYLVGALESVDAFRVAFEPSGRALRPGADPRDP